MSVQISIPVIPEEVSTKSLIDDYQPTRQGYVPSAVPECQNYQSRC